MSSQHRARKDALWLSTAAVATSAGAVFLYHFHCKSMRQLMERTEHLERQRVQERTGRIRAEVRLRTALKEQHQHHQQRLDSGDATSNNEAQSASPPVFSMRAIGTIVSPYTKRMGTPRQPQLCPSSRGFIQFNATIPPAAVDGMEEYSHVWIIFEFHANTNIQMSNNHNNNKKNSQKHAKSKIRPPRSPYKVGQLATRSPHRPNPVGLSLVTIDKWDPRNLRLHVNGLDLVHGTPVYDVKPCVPWDVPNFQNSNLHPQQQSPESTTITTDVQVASNSNSSKSTTNSAARTPDLMTMTGATRLTVPTWVGSPEDCMAGVEFTDAAVESLTHFVQLGKLKPLYSRTNDGVQGALDTLREILVQDPRSSHKGVDHARGSVGVTYNIVFCNNCRIYFTTTRQHVMVVTSIESISFAPETYVDGVPLLSEQQTLQD